MRIACTEKSSLDDRSVIERAAEALYEEGRNPAIEPPWPGRHPDAFRRAARAMLLAIRNPTSAMDDAPNADRMPDWLRHEDVWRYMIAEALKEC